MFKMGEFDKAKEIYKILINWKFDDDGTQLSQINNNLGLISQQKGDTKVTLSFYQKTLEIAQQYYPSIHPFFVTTYNNIDSFYELIADYIPTCRLFIS
jgi:tetratricopeptide (TPR) repeat protein